MKRYFLSLLCALSVITQGFALRLPNAHKAPHTVRAFPSQTTKAQGKEKTKKIVKPSLKGTYKANKKTSKILNKARKTKIRGKGVKSPREKPQASLTKRKTQANAQRIANKELARFKKTQRSKAHKDLLKEGERQAKEVLRKDVFSNMGCWM